MKLNFFLAATIAATMSVSALAATDDSNTSSGASAPHSLTDNIEFVGLNTKSFNHDNPKATQDVAYDMDNGVLAIADNRGFSLQSKDGNFVLKPYLMLQTLLNYNYYDDEGLDKAYNQDNVANSGFSIPFGIIGFTGKAFGKIDYNVSINAAASGGSILQQAWIDYAVSPAIRFRVGKQKTPFTSSFLTTLGETLFPQTPVSLSASTIMPYSLNAVNPSISTGWDLGFKMHGLIANKWGYEVGIFNGTGGSTNSATKGFSDDNHLPSLLYAGRFTFQGNGPMPATQGNPNFLDRPMKYQVGVSVNYNNEAEYESTNDFRAGVDFSMLCGRWSVMAEGYYMNVDFTHRQKIKKSYNFWGAYGQVGYFVAKDWQVGVRYDWMDRNGNHKDGSLNMPAVVCNYFIPKTNIKLSAMYQYMGRWGHDTQLDRDLDDLGLATHQACVMMQFCF